MSKLRQAFPNYTDLPENIKWITDRLEQLQALQQLATLTNEKAEADKFWLDIQREYKEKFGGSLVDDLVKFGEEYL